MLNSPAPRLSGYSLCLAAIAAFLIGLFLWTVNKGFDITDEGFYVLGYSYPEEYSSSFTSFNLIVSKLLNPAHTSIIGYRLASLFTTVASALLLAGGVRQWIKEKYQAAVLPFWLVASLFITGNFLQYSIFPRTIFYNNINSFCIAVFVSSILVYSAYPSATGLKWRHAFLYAGSAFMGIDLFVKGSSSVVAMATGLLVLVVYIGLAKVKDWYKPVGIVVLGFLTGVLLFFAGIQPFAVWRTNFVHETGLLLQTSYNEGLLVRYLKDAYPIILTLIYPFSLFIALSFFLTRAYLRGRIRLAPVLQLGAILVGVAFIGYETLRTGLYKITHLNHNQSPVWFLALLLVVLAIFCAAYLEQPFKKIKWRKVIIASWLIILPFVGAIGTYNNLFMNMMLDLNYWLALFCILYVSMPATVSQATLVRIIVFMVPAIVIAEQCTYGLVLAPYLQAANMLEQTVPVSFDKTPATTVLQLDPKTASFMGELEQAMQQSGFKPGMPVVALYDMPGLVYMLGGISPGNPWLFGHLDLRNCDALAKTKMDLSKAFVLVNEKPGEKMLQCMNSSGIPFPEGYTVVRRLLSPYSANQYTWRNYQDTLTVYAPLRR
ncbi:hypothetical protein [Hymenobacter elongatus]|uniref:Glycosyltransferase RgtA/B/C/D-like domain-containing protein n=1 Tax=Hymenobacter elongatus TaxID=877208 RepID=A0A4Z0PJ78_9BACT|nr:hypothetical protein [Hymenobacter elongatus]TGE15558.1 hypothetical protein E5J99_12205 [Hymenobacter elongatus]